MCEDDRRVAKRTKRASRLPSCNRDLAHHSKSPIVRLRHEKKPIAWAALSKVLPAFFHPCQVLLPPMTLFPVFVVNNAVRERRGMNRMNHGCQGMLGQLIMIHHPSRAKHDDDFQRERN